MTGVVNVAAVALPPGLTITSPDGGSVFADPASVKISAAATSASGSVTNVQFFSNGGSLGAVTTAAVSNFFHRVTNGQFVFNHTANPGLRYAVENTTNFTAWSPVATNTAASNSVEIIDTFQVGNLRFYRVGRLPNPSF